MVIIVKIVSFILLIALILSPILIAYKINKSNRKYKFVTFLSLGIIVTSIIMIFFGWWSDASNKILLSHYGYNFEAMNEQERFENVSASNLEQVKSLRINMMGIGWPLKVIMSYIFYFPYLLVLYLVTYLIQKKKIRTALNSS